MIFGKADGGECSGAHPEMVRRRRLADAFAFGIQAGWNEHLRAN